MKTLVLGASGQVGYHLMLAAARRGYEVVGTRHANPYAGLRQLDRNDSDATAALIRRLRPRVVFCPAAWSWVDGCERDPARARRENVDNVVRAAEIAAAVGARFVFFSSDYVFPGEGPAYREEDEPRPLNVYGETKLAAERALAALGVGALTVRTAVVYGPERQRKTAVYQLLRAGEQGRPIKVATDQVCSPTYSPNLASAALELAAKGVEGVVHVAGPEHMSRFEFAKLACTILKIPESILESATTDQFEGMVARRPLINPLDVAKAEGLLRQPLVGCAEGLSLFKAEAAHVMLTER
jgi:dTDP-4-dehydrorhamnose reductase